MKIERCNIVRCLVPFTAILFALAAMAHAAEVPPEAEQSVNAARPARPGFTGGRPRRFGVGVALLARTSPYEDDDELIVRAFPSLTYFGERLTVTGPFASYRLAGRRGRSVSANARLQLGVYEEDDSPVLAGMGDRKDTMMAGLAVRWRAADSWDFGLKYEYDLLDRIGGGMGSCSVSRELPVRKISISPSVGLNWLDKTTAHHFYGVPGANATSSRPAYNPGSALSIETGVRLLRRFAKQWSCIANCAAEWLDDGIKDSPIVETGVVAKGFLAVNYSF